MNQLLILLFLPLFSSADCGTELAQLVKAQFDAVKLPERPSFDQIAEAQKAKKFLDALPPANDREAFNRRVLNVREYFVRLLEPNLDPETSSWHFMKSLPSDLDHDRLHAYKRSAEDWAKAVNYVKANAEGRPVTIDLLKDLHKLGCGNIAFHGYEGRRLLARRRAGEIDEKEFKELLKRVYQKNEAVSGTPHSELVGRFRSDPLDQLVHEGSSRTPDGKRYFTKKEFEAFKNNKYATLDASSVKELSSDQIMAKFNYLDVSKVETATNEVMSRTIQALETEKSLERRVSIVLQMEKDLLSIHPFLDGNGRTVRVLADLLFQRMGLPPPIRPNAQDLEMSIEEAVEYTREQMKKYINHTLGASE